PSLPTYRRRSWLRSPRSGSRGRLRRRPAPPGASAPSGPRRPWPPRPPGPASRLPPTPRRSGRPPPQRALRLRGWRVASPRGRPGTAAALRHDSGTPPVLLSVRAEAVQCLAIEQGGRRAMKQVQAWAWITALLVAVLLVACGGGPPPPPTPTVEQSTPQQTASPEPAVATLVVAPSTVVLEATATSTPEPSPTAAPTSATPAPIQIEGSPEFVAWTNEALELLRTQAPEWYEQVFASIRTIRSVPAGSGMDVFGKVFKVGDITAYAPGFPPEQQ